MEELFEKLTKYNPSDIRIEMTRLEVPENVYENSMVWIHKHLCSIWIKMNAALENSGKSPEFQKELEDIVQEH